MGLDHLANPVHLKSVIPAAGSVGEYRGFLVYNGSTAAIDGDVWITNIQDSKVYVYRAADLEGPSPVPVKVFGSTDGVGGPHYLQRRPGTAEIWLTNRTSTTSGYLLRFDGATHAVITTPAARLETTGTAGDEPTEFAFSKDGLLAYVGHHGVERVLRYIEFGGSGVGYEVATTPDKKYLYISLGVPEQSPVVVVDAGTLTVVTNIMDPDLHGPRNVRFTSY